MTWYHKNESLYLPPEAPHICLQLDMGKGIEVHFLYNQKSVGQTLVEQQGYNRTS